MIAIRKVTRYQAWCVLCRWTGGMNSRKANVARDWDTHYRFFHGPEATGHKWNGHSYLNMGGVVGNCVCGGVMHTMFGSNTFERCDRASHFGFTLESEGREP